MKPIIYILGMSLHFGIMLWNNLQHSHYAYRRMKQEEPKALTEIMPIGRQLFQNSIFRLYAKISGTDMPYGFFAPNVGSQYITEFRLYDARDNICYTHGNPGLKTRESLNRYAGFTRLFESLLEEADKPDKHTSFDQNYSRAIASSMARYLGKGDTAISKVVVSIYLHQVSLQKNDNVHGPYFLIFQHTINL